jgi:hypothetical protein
VIVLSGKEINEKNVKKQLSEDGSSRSVKIIASVGSISGILWVQDGKIHFASDRITGTLPLKGIKKIEFH